MEFQEGQNSEQLMELKLNSEIMESNNLDALTQAKRDLEELMNAVEQN